TPAEGFVEIWKCFEYFNEIWQQRQAASTPGEDLISFLAHGEATKNMAPNEFLGNVLLLIVGGNDTTRNSISAGVQALNRYPEEYDKLRGNLGLIPNMVSEIVRWQSPVAHMCRTALEDVEIGGRQIRKMDKLAIWYLSGNRDETHFADANRLLIDRPNVRQHLSFGYGIHRCLGNRLAEMQLRILWEEIMARFSQVEVVGDASYLNSSFIRGITELPVRVHDR
ncbi:MAG: cytochrome P450, partial [Gammaproteobacteria bacterium]